MKATRETIITSMCYTLRHDYGLQKDESCVFGSGMTPKERQALWNVMAQIFDNDIAPHMELKPYERLALTNKEIERWMDENL